MVKEENREIEIRGNKLSCPICKNNKFWEKDTLMNTRGISFLGISWTNKEAENYICSKCGYVYWFLYKN